MSELGVNDTLFQIISLGLLVISLLISGYVLARFSDDSDGLVAGLRERFVLGVPWGTLIVITLVAAVYYLVQGGSEEGGPIVTGFRSWSLWYPQGTLFSSFAHSSDGHLMGNLFGTLAFAPIVEYAWRHYPRETGDPEEATDGTDADLGRLDDGIDTAPSRPDTLLQNPYARIGIFVCGVFLVGLLGSIIVPGAVIGFSGVVFAFAGFALVTFPIATVLAILGIQVVRLVHRSVTDPWVIEQSSERFVRPSWADIAIQGHLYGLLVGVLLAVLLLEYRDRSPNLRHVFFAALVFAVTRSLQSVYWFLGNERYILFQAIGTAGVFLLATIIALTVIDSERLLVPELNLRTRNAAVGLLLAFVLALALLGIPYNLVSVSGGDEIEGGIEVHDYTVTYAEDVEDRYISALDLPIYQGPSVNMSGVIVASEQRNIWERSVSDQELASDGSATIAVGDATWRETVDIQRIEWTVAGGNSTYKILGHHDGETHELYASESAQVEMIINDSMVSISPTPEFYEIIVEDAQTDEQTVLGSDPLPDDGEQTTIADITFERDGNKLFARHDRTVVQIAEFSA